MIKSLTTAACIVAISGSLAFAQSSQGQSGAATSPTSVNAQTMQSNPMDSNAKMKKKKMKKGMKSGMSGGMSKDGMSGSSNTMGTGMGAGNMGGSARKDGMGSGMAK